MTTGTVFVLTKVCCRHLLCTTYLLPAEVPDNQGYVRLAVCEPHDHTVFHLCETLKRYFHEPRLSRLRFRRWLVICTNAKSEFTE